MKTTFLVTGFLLCLFFAGDVCGQISVHGTVTDSSLMPLGSANVTLFNKTKGIIIAYAISDAKGNYQLKSNEVFVKDSLRIEVFMLGFSRKSVPLIQQSQLSNFRLVPSSNMLPEVTVKNNRILVRLEGDTLSYDVAAFSSPQDRVIGDILKKLPGIQVDDNGKITYNGKDINRFYIDGENLLDGKYNIATRSIPNDMVAKVQVLENHQPVKSLKNILPSGDPAINIVTKENARLKPIGSGDAAAGVPGLYSSTVNVMLFKKKTQFINSYKLNNIGTDLNYDIISHFNGGQDNIPSPLMSIGIGNAPLKKSRYLFNHSGLLDVNNLIKLKNDLNLRINASYLYDKQYRSSSSSVYYYLPTDTIHYEENQTHRAYANSVKTQFTLTANNAAYYLNSVLLLENRPIQSFGSLKATGGINIDQQLSGTTTNISNELNYIKVLPRSKNAIEGYSYFNHVSNPSTLQVEPGLNPGVFNNGIPFAALVQQAAIPTVFTNNYISYRTTGKIRQSYKTGFSIQQQELNSVLESQQLTGSRSVIADSFINRLQWERLKVFAQGDFSLVTSKVEITLSVPAVYLHTNYSSRVSEAKIASFPVAPSVSFRYNSGKESYFSGRYGYNSNWGDIKNVYDGYIMQNYRSFMANVAFLPYTRVHSSSLSYYFKNTLKIFFFDITASYASVAANSLLDNKYSVVLQQSKNILFDNITENKSLSGSVSKYIFPLKATIGARAAWQISSSNQLLNGDLLRYRNNVLSLGTSLNAKMGVWGDLAYSNTFSMYSSQAENPGHTGNSQPNEIFNSLHQTDVNLTLQKHIYLKLRGEYYYSHYPSVSDNKAFFGDVVCTYKWDKLKTDIELTVSNLANTSLYSNLSVSSNAVYTYTYQIRPRMAMLKFLFRF